MCSATMLTSVIAGLGTYLWMVGWGIPYPALLGLLVALLDLIPVVGSTIGGAIVTLVALTVSIPVALATLAFYVGYRFAEDYLVVPRIMGRAVQVHRPSSRSWPCWSAAARCWAWSARWSRSRPRPPSGCGADPGDRLPADGPQLASAGRTAAASARSLAARPRRPRRPPLVRGSPGGGPSGGRPPSSSARTPSTPAAGPYRSDADVGRAPSVPPL